jgi:hypothetical protein
MAEPTGRRYLAYMLRLREVDGESGPLWRVSLDSVSTGQHVGLASLEDLIAYLRRQTEGTPSEDADPQGKGVSYGD